MGEVRNASHSTTNMIIIDDELDPVYKEMIMEHGRHPRNKGAQKKYDSMAEDSNDSCGDNIRVFIKYDARARVSAVSHESKGCVISQAAISLLTEEIKGKTREEIRKLRAERVFKLLGVPISAARLSCALLGYHVIKKCVRDARYDDAR